MALVRDSFLKPPKANTKLQPVYSRNTTFYLIKTVAEADLRLSAIVDGYVGFDTEFVNSPPGPAEVAALAATAGTRVDRLRYHRNRVSSPAFVVNWTEMHLCLAQISTASEVYILDFKRIRAIPQQFVRILGARRIFKVGTGFQTDGKVLFEAFGVSIRSFVDVGYLIRLAFPERYATHNGPLSLEAMVQDLLQQNLDKSMQTVNWAIEYEVDDQQILYAGLDAQASREVYSALLLPVRQKEQTINRLIRDDWFTFDFIAGEARTVSTALDGVTTAAWSYTLCPWYRAGQFAGYHS
ncbi:ribonuclease H-like domain-containing protein [Mycena metata]|uniref:3'-5' exonuclease n=1 Tax=Mycena metata TaxID=1033252 RepID=A0AAD7NZ76_9AGAR|nr:ribonuclease H-like domain-containing protein [Mycena metata]